MRKRSWKPDLKNPVLWAMLFATVVLLWTSANMKWGDGRWNRLVKVDGTGYFSYLPAIFVYQDLTFSFHDSIARNPVHREFYFDYRKQVHGKTVNKYYAGTALLMLPFYLAGHALNALTGQSMDGFSVWVLIMTQIAAIFYTLLGLWWLHLSLKLYSANQRITAIVLLAALFGTNLFYYVSEEPAMSHAYSFAMVSLFIYTAKMYFIARIPKYFVWSMVAFGLIVLIRPVNALVIISLPFIAGSYTAFKSGWRALIKKPNWLMFGLVLAVLITGIQNVIYWLQTGHPYVFSYQGEGFNFSEIHFFDFLFSYKKGFFLYTPLAFVALGGLVFLYRQSKYAAWWLLGFLVLVIYILSSWWLWYYGGSFSSRVMVEYLPYFMVLLGLMLTHIKIPKTVIGLIIVLTLFCQLQTYQYRYGYLHYDSMTSEKYWDLMLNPLGK